MITKYNEEKKKQQKAILTKLLEHLDKLEIEYLCSEPPAKMYYTEEEYEHINYKQVDRVHQLIECLRTLKRHRRAERLTPFSHNI